MKLLALSASVFYLLGLKLTTQIHVNPTILGKPAVIESKSGQATKPLDNKTTAKPFATPKDTTLSAEKKNPVPEKNTQKAGKLPAARKGSA